MQYNEIMDNLKKLSNPKNVEGMARFGINPKNTLGISVYVIRDIAKSIGKNHSLAQELWDSGVHEARLLAGFVDDPKQVTENQMEMWVKDFDSWDICDQVCSNLFDKTEFAWKKAIEWTRRDEEFVKRSGFVLMASLSVHDKDADDSKFEKFFPLIMRESGDDRNFVRKAVNWALRQIGKRNRKLNRDAIGVAKKISRMNSKSSKWIAADALRELTSENVRKRLSKS